MDMTKLTQKHSELVEHLEEVGYSPGYLHIIERTIAYLLENSSGRPMGQSKRIILEAGREDRPVY